MTVNHDAVGSSPSTPANIGANVPRLARRSPKPLGWVRFPTVPAICASNSVGRVAAFGEVIQLEENANASSNLAFSTISRLSGVRVTSGAPSNNKRKLESFLKIIYNIYIKLRKE